MGPTKKDSKTKCCDYIVIVNITNTCVSSRIILMNLLILRFSTCFVEFSQNFSVSLTDQLTKRADMASASAGEQRRGSLRSVSELPPIRLCFRDLIPFPEYPPSNYPQRMGLQHHNHLEDHRFGKIESPSHCRNPRRHSALCVSSLAGTVSLK